MIPIERLSKLSPLHRMRKSALVLGGIERELLASRGKEPDASTIRFSSQLARLLGSETTAAVSAAARALARLLDRDAGEGPEAGAPRPSPGLARAVDALRHALLAATGQAPADWDLLDPNTGLPDPGARTIFAGRKVYLEDLRSPFNVGSIFRTADAFGVEELLLSPACAEPLHPRARRSAMGAIELLPWRRADLESLSGEIPVFALELGGERIDRFRFPERAVVVLGSEELGVSEEARRRCTMGSVSIPMGGAKASLNVGVAFGILMYAWTYNWFD